MFCLINSKVISSLGENPVRGGRPARDRRISIVVVIRMGVLGQEVEISVIFVDATDIRDKNIAVVIMI